MIVIRDTSSMHYRVTDAGAGLEHLFNAVPVKLVKGAWLDKTNAKPRLIRRHLAVVVFNK